MPGRLERIDAGQDFTVLVDYAHTEDALSRALTAARELTPGRLVVVFGCGGDRDRTKRPKMGRVAASLADIVILTSDNPRTEDPLEILGQAGAGVLAEGSKVKGSNYFIYADRAEAISFAVRGRPRRGYDIDRWERPRGLPDNRYDETSFRRPGDGNGGGAGIEARVNISIEQIIEATGGRLLQEGEMSSPESPPTAGT